MRLIFEEEANETRIEQAVDANPSVSFHEEFGSVLAGDLQEFAYAAGMEVEVGCHVVHLTMDACPGILLALMSAQLRPRNPSDTRHRFSLPKKKKQKRGGKGVFQYFV